MSVTARRAVAAELVGTLFLLAGVVGSGIMGERLADGNQAVALLANSIATGGILFAIITALGPISGAHLNPLVSLIATLRGELPPRRLAAYVAAQLAGAVTGVALANGMFGHPALEWSHHARHGAPLWLGETVATFGLVLVIFTLTDGRRAAAVVAAYIVAAYWFTSSTSFANPAVTLARALSDSFAGIRLGDVPGFVLAQLAGAAAAVLGLWVLGRGRAAERA